MAPIHDDDSDDDSSEPVKPPGGASDSGNGDSASLLTTVAKRAVPRRASATQTFTDLDHRRISEQALRSVDIVDRPSLLWELEPHAAPAPPESPSVEELSLSRRPPSKYATVAEIGHGGMGDVFAVHDVDLQRTVALKRIRKDMLTPRAVALFLQEAQVTAQLEHPNIVPVHDSGRTASGEAFFTMKLLRGLTLRQVLSQLGSCEKSAARRFTRIRLGIVFLEVVRAVAYAHVRGVVHCDLKPSNVLIGAHDEVVVGDWGLARADTLLPPPPSPATATTTIGQPQVPAAERVHFPPGAPDFKGVISGSIPYMAPEQLTSDDIDRRVDVYALGAILYEVLTLQPISRAANHVELLKRIKLGVVPPRERAPFFEISDEVEAICLKCLRADPVLRFQSAVELQEAIENWLTGTRRRAAADEAFSEGEREHARVEALHAERGFLLEEKRRLEQTIKPFDTEAKKQPLWDVEDRLFHVDLEGEEATANAIDAWQRSASLDGSFLPPQDRLADVHLRMFLDAEDRGRALDEQLHRRQVERYHRGRHAAILDGRGVVTIRPVDGGVSISGHALVERGKKIVAGDALDLVRDDMLDDVTLPMGSYVFDLTPPPGSTLRAARVHVRVGRGTRIELEPRLYPDDVIGKNFVYVPAGPYLAGGDDTALNSEPRVERSLPDYFICKYPVTCGEYARFLNDLAAESPHLARQHAPRTRPDGGPLWEQGVDGRYELPRHDADGNPVLPDAPVMCVSFFDAEMYAAHLAKKEGLPYRLPTEHEWEKAARGADGRFFPWGNGFDPSFCKMSQSRPGRPQPEPVGSFPVDESVYGMRDAAGTIREWTDSFFDPSRETRTLRGGAWYFNPHYCRLAFRHGYLPNIVFANFGFRIGKSPP